MIGLKQLTDMKKFVIHYNYYATVDVTVLANSKRLSRRQTRSNLTTTTLNWILKVEKLLMKETYQTSRISQPRQVTLSRTIRAMNHSRFCTILQSLHAVGTEKSSRISITLLRISIGTRKRVL